MKLPYTQRELWGIAAMVLFFAVAQYYARRYSVELQGMIGKEERVVGMAIYAAVAIGAIVVAPISSLPLVPIAASAWGSFVTALITLAAWTAGSIAAFLIARIYGRRIIGRVVDRGSMRKLERLLGADGMFVSALLLRMVVPVDILSYALGLFSTIRTVPYVAATVIGMVPFILFFSYAIQIPVYWQAALAISTIAVVFFILKKRLKV